jgi:tetratricopeptide (TPR) repeat protein
MHHDGNQPLARKRQNIFLYLRFKALRNRMSSGKKNAAKKMLQDSTAVSERVIIRRMIIFFFVLCFVLFGRSIGNKYSMDDELVILNNEQVHKGISAIPEIFRTTYVIDAKSSNYEYRPLVKVSFAIEYELFGENPHVSHVINILLYFVNIVLLFAVLRRILKGYHLIIPFLVTALFLVHPLHSEVVLSIKNRDVMLSFLGSFLSLWFFLNFADRGKVRDVLLAMFFFLFALLSKKDSITMWVIIPVAIYFFTNASFKKIGLVTLLTSAPFFISRFLTKSAVNGATRELFLFENPFFFEGSIIDRIPLGLHCIWFYLKMFIVPRPLLSYYGFNQVPVPGWSSPTVWLSIVIIAAAGWYIIRNIRSRNPIAFGMLYFFISISMFLNIVKPVVGIVGERFAYLPSVGLCIIAVLGTLKLLKLSQIAPELRFSRINSKLYLVFGLVFLIYSVEVIARNPDWKDHYSLYKADAAKAPESAHLHTLLAASSIQMARQNPSLPQQKKNEYIKDAVAHYRESIRIIPDYITSHNNLGMVYLSFYQRPDLAMPHLKKAILLDTNYVEAYFNLASCEAAVKQYDSAERHFQKTLELNPDFTNAYTSLSSLYAMDKQYDKILLLNEKAIEKGVRSDVPYINIGNAYIMKGDTLKAVPYLEKAVGYNPRNPELNRFLAGFYERRGDWNKADYYNKIDGQSGN